MQGTQFNNNNFFEGLMRGAMASLRGYAEAKVAVAQAGNDAELQRANSRLAQARNDILRRRNEIDLQLGQAQIASNEQIAEEERKAQQFNVVTTTEGKKYIVDAQGQSAAEVAEIQSGTAKSVAETGAEAQTGAAQIGADAQVKSAQIGADATVKAAEAGAKATADAAQLDYDKAIRVAELQMEEAQGVANIKRQTELDSLFYEKVGGVGGAGTISVEASRHFMSVLSAVRQTDAYKLLNASQSAAQRVLALYKDGGSPEKDITFMNIFQRVIDPGVSVREGDVQLQQSTMPYIQQMQAAVDRIQTGVVLTPDMRQGMVEALMTLANADYDLLLPAVQASVGDQLSQNAELVQTGRNTPESLFYVPLQRFEGSPVIDAGTGGVTLSTGAQGASDGRMTRTPGQEPSQAESRIVKLVNWAKLRMSEGRSGQEIRQMLVERLDKTVSDPAQRQQILSAVDAQVNWDGTATGGGGAPRSMDKRRQ